MRSFLALTSLLLASCQAASHETPMRRTSTEAESEASEHVSKRNLRLRKKKKQEREEDELIMKRMIVLCPLVQSLEQCGADLKTHGDEIVVVHQLLDINSLAIQLEINTIDDLEAVGYLLSEDNEREALYLEDSLQEHRRMAAGGDQEIPYGVDLINAIAASELYGVDGSGVKVCILDTGVAASHEDLVDSSLDGWNITDAANASDPEFLSPWDQDVLGHGTHVTGIVAAANNTLGVRGVAPGVGIYMVRVFQDNRKFYGSDVVAAVQECHRVGSDIISMSLGGSGHDEGEHAVFQTMYDAGVLAVASAGNSGRCEPMYPASYMNVVSVGACTDDRRIAGFSTFNSFVDIIAPGVAVKSTWKNGNYATLSGTSMAGPHVVGALALMKEYKPSATVDELLIALLSSVQPLRTNVYIGLVDALQAMAALGSVDTQSPLEGCVDVQLTVNTDRYGPETSYGLKRQSDKAVFWRGKSLKKKTRYFESSCVDPLECYEFVVRDDFGDGIIGTEGSILLMFNGTVIMDDSSFGKGVKHVFGGEGCL